MYRMYGFAKREGKWHYFHHNYGSACHTAIYTGTRLLAKPNDNAEVCEECKRKSIEWN